MREFETTNGQTQLIIPLRVAPFSHQAMPTITGSLFSQEAGTVLYGNYTMEYLLPAGDKLRLIANHHKKTVQLMLFTHDSDLIQRLPGERYSSLVSNIINRIHHYKLLSDSYKRPLSPEQEEKLKIANHCIQLLSGLLKKERRLQASDFKGHEELRREVIGIINECKKNNRLIAINPVISEGTLSDILYDAHKTAQHYQFNRVYPVSHQDQMDFRKIIKEQDGIAVQPIFVWDSEIHVGHDTKELDNALRVICQHYHLSQANQLINLPSNRFSKLEQFLKKLLRDGQDWIDYLAIDTKPHHKTEIQERSDGVSITKITPYYKLKGLQQKGYDSLNEFMTEIIGKQVDPIEASDPTSAKSMLAHLNNGHWVVLSKEKAILVRQDNKLVQINYFVHDQLFYPLPEGDDLYTLSQISKRHLYLPERASLRLKGFLSRVPTFFSHFFRSMQRFIVHDLKDEFIKHIHAGHVDTSYTENDTSSVNKKEKTKRTSLHLALEENGFLANGQTIEEFIEEQIKKSPYVIARANHPPSPPTYENPLHRVAHVLRHIAGFFIDTSERNPLIGTLAMAAYAYGAGAVLAPNALTSILTKLHLKGLIYGIEPVQKLGHFLNHGKTSEAVAASITLWQSMVAGGNLDKFFINAVSALKEDPAEIAIIASLALSLGYGLTKAIPALQHEMGDFPYTNYAALGGKGGAAIYDTIMHPGDDWLLGSCKWLFKHIISLGKLTIAPFFEWYYYGYRDGFIHGWKKNHSLVKQLGKQFIAACADLLLLIATVPLVEISALFIHVPFMGISNFFQKLLGGLGNLKALGNLFTAIAQRPSSNNYIAEFRMSPLYGFTSPFGHFSDNAFINIGIVSFRILFLPLWQCLKNFILLPLIDVVSMSTRIFLTLINPASRIVLFGLGKALYSVGLVSDLSIGLLCTLAAKLVTVVTNEIDQQAGELKHWLLSSIEIKRSELFHWGFHEEDLSLHTELNDRQYFHDDPRRAELMPHDEKHCLLDNLLSDSSITKSSPYLPPKHFPPLFETNSLLSFTSGLQNDSLQPNISLKLE